MLLVCQHNRQNWGRISANRGGGLGPGLKFSGKMWGNVTKQEENAGGLPTQ